MSNHLQNRIVAAALAACTTLVLFTAVVSIAPPQERAELLARAAAPSARQPAVTLAQAPVVAQLLAFNAE